MRLRKAFFVSFLLIFYSGKAVHPEENEQASMALRKVLRKAGIPVGDPEAAPVERGFRVLAAAQDWAQPTPDLSCHTLTPLKIGKRTFESGIGAHSNGRIEIELARPFRRFTAFVGVDNNWDTAGTRGSVEFIVKVDGAEKARTGVLRCGHEPRKVEVDLTGASRLELIISDGGDGISYDQADWAEAVLEAPDGGKFSIGDAFWDGFEPPFFERLPLSFRLGGEECWTLLKGWKGGNIPKPKEEGSWQYRRKWVDPGSGLETAIDAVLFDDPPALEIGCSLMNGGPKQSEIVSDIFSIDLEAPSPDRRSYLISSSGGLTGDFAGRPERLGFELSTAPLGEKTLTVNGGRSSNGDLPFFILREGGKGWGMAMALGWSGQWKASARWDQKTGNVIFQAGLEPASFRLEPGESVALPKALLVPFRGTDSEGANRLRRVLRERYQARLDGKPVLPPVSFNSWFVFENRVSDALLRDLAREAAALGIEYFCLDAGWFDGDFPGGVGNWTVNREKFPGGLRPVSDHVRSLGMKFGLWFEPERVAPGTRWAKEHPDLVTGDLLDLGKPEARKLVFEMLDSHLTEARVDWIRFDFNTDPLGAWKKTEDPYRQGLRQIRHVNGLYEVLDGILGRHPGLLIEQCSSGGRRIDLETVRRGHTFWKSDDTFNQPLMRFHEAGGNFFLPGGLLNTNLCRYRSQGELLALFGGPLGFGLDMRKLSEAERSQVRETIAAYKRLREFIDEDFYPLFPQSTDPRAWTGLEFIDPGRQEGYFFTYRPADSPYSTAEVSLSGLRPEARYRLKDELRGEEKTASGNELSAGFKVSLEREGAQVWRFTKD